MFIHKIFTLLWTFKVAMFSFTAALRGLGPSRLMTSDWEPANSEYSVDSDAVDYIPDFDIETKDN